AASAAPETIDRSPVEPPSDGAEKRDAPMGWGGELDEPGATAASGGVPVIEVEVPPEQAPVEPAAASLGNGDPLSREAARLEESLANAMEEAPRSISQQMKAVAPPEPEPAPEGVVLKFPSAPNAAQGAALAR